MTIKNNYHPLAPIAISMALALSFSVPVLAQGGPPAWAPRPVATTVAGTVTAAEAKSLTFMREEEKLARDVYDVLYKRWNLSVFDRIAASEDVHFDSIGVLLARYSVPDPARNDVAGVFSNPELITLYAQLTAKGLTSLKDALEVGVIVEKKDIADLEAALKTAVQTDIRRVYTNLMAASYNHLDAFETNLEVAGLLR